MVPDGLEVRGLTKQFGAVRALDGLELTVRPGRILGFLGPNGAGKTTAMRCILGLTEPDGGSVRWLGAPIDDTRRLEFGYMPEERGLYPKMRVVEQLEYFGRLSGMAAGDARAEALAWLERLDLADRSTARLEQLSHGNQQRVQLATALVHRPSLAVLDEPFAGLDPIGVETMTTILRSVAADGTAVLFSSHQLELVEDVCQDVVIIDSGRAVLSGELEALRTAAPVRHLEIDVAGSSIDGTNGALVPADLDLVTELQAAAMRGPVTRVVFEPPNLNDLFRQAVSR